MQLATASVPRLALALLVVGVVGAGVVGFWPADTTGDTGQRIGVNASERLAELDGLSATVETTIQLGNRTNRTTQRVWLRPGTRQLRAQTFSDGQSTLTVSNGSVYWVYRPAENTASKLDVSGYDATGQQRGERIERIFTRLNVSRDAPDEPTSASITPGAAPLPSVPGGSGQSLGTPTPAVEEADQFGVRYNGTAEVSGREVYVISIRTEDTGNASVLEDYEQTMYIDTEYFFPIKTHTEWRSDGERIASTSVYRNLTFNPGLDDSRFEFDPPENVTISETNTPAVERYDSIAAARQNTSLPVPDGEVPPSFDLDTVQAISGNFSSVSLRYSNETATLTLSVNDITANATNVTSGERFTADGRDLSYRRFGTSQSVSWQCDDYRYSVTGTAVGRDTLVDIALSVECS